MGRNEQEGARAGRGKVGARPGSEADAGGASTQSMRREKLLEKKCKANSRGIRKAT